MPNIKSAKKRVLVSATKQARNKADKTALKTILKKVDADTNADNVKVAVKAVCLLYTSPSPRDTR